MYRKGLLSQSRFAEFHFQLGQCLFQMGRHAEAGKHLSLALDADAHPARANRDYRRVVSEVCKELAIPVVDAPTFLRPHTKFGILDHSFLHRPVIAILFVHPDHRRTGLGSALITHFESITKEPKLWISTNIENLAMQGALHKHGYNLAGVINNLGDIPELFYWKVIDPAS